MIVSAKDALLLSASRSLTRAVATLSLPMILSMSCRTSRAPREISSVSTSTSVLGVSGVGGGGGGATGADGGGFFLLYSSSRSLVTSVGSCPNMALSTSFVEMESLRLASALARIPSEAVAVTSREQELVDPSRRSSALRRDSVILIFFEVAAAEGPLLVEEDGNLAGSAHALE